MQFEIYRSKGKFRWRLRGDNGEILANGEAYSRRIDCMKVINLVREVEFAEVEDLTTPKGASK